MTVKSWPAIFLVLLVLAMGALAEPAFHEFEPNNQPADFHRIDGEISLSGTMLGGDQDGFLWTVSDTDARKRWSFELQGIPGALTITDIVVLEYADNGVDVTGKRSLMKMGTRDGSKASIHEGLIFEPGEYVIGFAQMGASATPSSGAAYRPPMAGLSFFAENVTTQEEIPADEGDVEASPGAYRFLIREHTLRVATNPGPRESRDDAYKMRLNSEFTSFEPNKTAWYNFTFNEKNVASRWDIRLQVPVGRQATARLVDADGKKLTEGRTDDKGRLRFADLAPPVGTWYLEVTTRDPGFVQLVAANAVGQRVDGEEAEPNDTWATANRIDLTQPLTGRSSGAGNTDYFFFTVDDATADQLLTLQARTDPEVNYRFCLTTESRKLLQCKTGTGQVELPDLLLQPGIWGLYLQRAKEAAYTISLIPQGPIKSGVEVEPNDYIASASGVPGNLRIKGRFSGNETDFYQLLVPGEAQLWRFQVIGDGVYEVRHYDGTGRLNAAIRPQGERRIRLDNLFLLPGRHYLSIQGKGGGSYTMLARALGPPDPNGEIEPNDQHNKQRLLVGQTRTGLLSEKNDRDYYRFFVGNWDHLKLTIQPPADGSIQAHLYWYSAHLGTARPGPGEPLVMQGLFPPGDYYFNMSPATVSDAEYAVSLERLPRFNPPSDSEPNGYGRMYLAAPLPPDLVLEGSSGQWKDKDYFQLPPFDQPTALLLRTAEPVAEVSVGALHSDRERLSHDAEQGAYQTTIPAGKAHRVYVDSRQQPYRIQLEFPGGELTPVTEPLQAELTLDFEHSAVSAYRINGQRVVGQLSIRNSGDAPIEANLEAVTSDFRWQVALKDLAVSVPPAGEIKVPVEVLVPGDAWADWPVRISAMAIDAKGRQAETWQEIDVTREIPSVSPYLYWAIPDALRGGFNAAWVPFGGSWTDDTPKMISGNDTLRDDLVFPGAVATCCGAETWRTNEQNRWWTIDLPGDDPLPVAGVAINLFGDQHEHPMSALRRATLMLSLDGVTFEEALTIDARALKSEQHFALPEPIPARFARLRTENNFSERTGSMKLSEWKVILEPGYDLSGGKGFNIADKALGGHVAWDWPPRPYIPGGIVQEGGVTTAAHMPQVDTRDYVIGFNQNRAAQITSVDWKYSGNTAEAHRNFASVAVSASTESSVGPWVPLGVIDLADAPLEASLDLGAPAWARFVRLTATRNAGGPTPHAPDVIRIWERPTDDEYRSVATEWGDLTSRAYYELQAGLRPEASLLPVDNDTRERAAPLAVDARAFGQVSLGKQEHWYRLTMPQGDNTLRLQLDGDPTVRTRLELQDASGESIPFSRISSEETPSKHLMEAIVDPGADVWINVGEPPRNVVFTWDTSASVTAHIHTINNALVAFSSQVVPGREAVNLMPFANSLLLKEWYGEPYMLQTTLNDYRQVGSSSTAHRTLKNAARSMRQLPGTKAIVVITDAESPNDGGMWGPMQEVQPRIFSIGVAGSQRYSHDLLRDWSAVNGGHFTQLRYDGEMEVAFDRATTLMHRPAGYTLSASSEYREAPGPGLLNVVAGDGGTGTGAAAVELILDASGSMLQRIDGKRRIAVAKEVLTEAVREHIPAGTPVALRVFGHKEVDSCRTDLEIPLAPLDAEVAAAKIASINAMNLARTPIAESLAAVEGDLKSARTGIIVLVTDGEETCEGDPGAVIQALRDKGFQVSLNIVGFAIDDAELAAQFEAWAELGGGRYLGASDQSGLSEAIEQALRVSYTVYDRGGNELATGEVGGEPMELERGNYRVVVNSVPKQTFDQVMLQGEDAVTLRLE